MGEETAITFHLGNVEKLRHWIKFLSLLLILRAKVLDLSHLTNGLVHSGLCLDIILSSCSQLRLCIRIS